MHQDATTVYKCAQVGADGYLDKMEIVEEIVQGIETVNAGKEYYGNRIQQILLYDMVRQSNNNENHAYHRLSSQEKDVLFEILSNNSSLSEIAKKMNVSVNSVKSYYRRLMSKLGLENITELRQHFTVPELPKLY